MLRLTLMLCAAIYAGLVIYSDDSAPAQEAPAAVTRSTAPFDATRPGRMPSDSLVTADGRVLTIAAVIDPVALDDGQAAVQQVSTPGAARSAQTVTASASTSAPSPDAATGGASLPLVEVTGTRVNLRAGPSTEDAVLDALTLGAQAELLAALDNGWVQIRTVDNGVEGYMADRFLAPVN
ncbi:MAG: SH3 domain-containing protein [Roseicyclus sp.]|jgi:hypothetical protein|nr:SH3 domain-containing protein [Roseicyclus sp.]